MPDRDIFNRRVEPGWQTAARHAYRGDADTLTLASLLRALGDLCKRGCPGIDKIAEAVVASGPACTPEARRHLRRELEQIQRSHLCPSTDLAADAVLRLAADDGALAGRLPAVRREEGKRLVVEAVLVEIAEAKISSSALLGSLSEQYSVSLRMLMDRFHRAAQLLERTPQLTRLAEQLLQQPDGQAVTRPRVVVPKPSQEDLLNLAIGS